MLPKNLSDRVLTVGCEFRPPRGGIAQVLWNYEKYVYPRFKFVANSGGGNKVAKLLKAFTGLVRMAMTLAVDKDVEIVHIHTASYNSFWRSSWFVRVAKVFGKKVVIHIHGGGFKEYYAANKDFVSQVLERCDALVTLSASWKTFFEDVVGHKKVFVVHNIVEPPVMKAVGQDGLFHLLYLGHIYKAKGIFDLVEVVRCSHVEYRGRLVLDIGGGMYEADVLKHFIEQHGLEDVIRFHGWVGGDRKHELLNVADAFILPSYTEGVPISILEAESYGLPVLSTTVGGIPEVVEDGKNGFLFQAGDLDKMKQVIDKLLNDEALREEQGRASKQISMKYLPNEVTTCLKRVYEMDEEAK